MLKQARVSSGPPTTVRNLANLQKGVLGTSFKPADVCGTLCRLIRVSAADGYPTSLAQGRQDDKNQRPDDLAGTNKLEKKDPTAHAAALSRVLGLGQPRLMALVHRCPDLFRFSPQALAATLEALAELTGLQVVQVPQLVSADPHLLLRPDRLKTNMRELAQALGIPAREVVLMGAREPAVLALSGSQAEERLRALLRMLNLQARQYGDLVAAVLRNPGTLLVPDSTTVEVQLQALEAALEAVLSSEDDNDGDVNQAQTHISNCGSVTGPADSSTCVQSSSSSDPLAITNTIGPPLTAAAAHAGWVQPSQGQIPLAPPVSIRHRVGVLVLTKPSLLSTPPQLLAGRLVHLAVKARVTPAQVLDAAICGPDLLAASSCFIDRHCVAVADALSHAGGCAGGASEAAEILVSEPRLLEQNVGSLSAKWLLLTSMFRSGSSGNGGGGSKWEQRLASAAVSERAALLVMPHSRLVRLRFLADSRLQDQVDPLEALRCSDPWFYSRYPEFKQWQEN